MIVFGLIGYPLSHSFSEKYFSEKFRNENLKDMEYRLFPLPSLEDLPAVLSVPGLRGLNVTIPYKQKILEWIDEVDERSAKTGAVNTIKITGTAEHRIIRGYNTDIEGFLNSADFSGYTKALVLGTGGAARAVAFALESIGIKATYVSREAKPFDHLLYRDLNREIISDHRLIINATPAGMYPEINSYPEIPYEYLTADHFLYDLIYNPGVTLFLEKGAEKGALTQNGMKMLMLQAEASFRIWTAG